MFTLTRQTDYALVALAGLSADERASVSARDLADRLHLPLPALRNVLKRLAQHGVLSSAQGAAGGYRLARAAERISVAEVIEVIEGPAMLTRCCGEDENDDTASCALACSCRIKTPVQKVHGLIQSLLRQVSVADLSAPTPAEGSLLRAPELVAVARPAGDCTCGDQTPRSGS